MYGDRGGLYLGRMRCGSCCGRAWVVVLDNLAKGHRAAVPAGTPFVRADIRDAAVLAETFEVFPTDAVMHFAAVSEVGESMADPAKYYRDNVAATLSLLESLHKANIRKIVFSSTRGLRRAGALPISRDSPLSPTNVYGRTKLVIENMLAEFAMAYGFSYSRCVLQRAALCRRDLGEVIHRKSSDSLILKTLSAASAIPLWPDYRAGLNLRPRLHSCDRLGEAICCDRASDDAAGRELLIWARRTDFRCGKVLSRPKQSPGSISRW